MQKMLLFDLDDTLINTHFRHYKVVADFLSLNGKKIEFEEYLQLRRDKNLTNKELIKKFEPFLANNFNQHWANCIESEHYLQYDTTIVSPNLLNKLINQGYILGIVSLRSNNGNASAQLRNFNWHSYFEKVSFLRHDGQNNPKIKVLEELRKQYEVAALVGDAITDKQAAGETAVPFYGVRTGFYKSDASFSFNHVNEFIFEFLKKS